MTFSEPLTRHSRRDPGPFYFSILAANGVNASASIAVHDTVHNPRSPRYCGKRQLSQQLQAVAPAANAGRRVGAGAGATPVFAAVIRRDIFLVRWLSLVGRSRTCPYFNCESKGDSPQTRIHS